MAEKYEYTFINKSVVPRPFRGNILRFNKPVTMACVLTKEEVEYLRKSGVLFIQSKVIEPKKKVKKESPKKEAKKTKSKKDIIKNDEVGISTED